MGKKPNLKTESIGFLCFIVGSAQLPDIEIALSGFLRVTTERTTQLHLTLKNLTLNTYVSCFGLKLKLENETGMEVRVFRLS